MTAVPSRTRARTDTDPLWLRVLALTLVIGFLGVMILLPLATVFVQGLSRGLAPAWAAIREHDALAALQLTLLIAAISVPFNAVFGVCASWAVAVWPAKWPSCWKRAGPTRFAPSSPTKAIPCWAM